MSTLEIPRPRRGDSHRREDAWYLGAVGIGAILIVVAAITQPFNQNEIKQMAPYGSNSYTEITGGTRQPPLDPLLGALVQHLLGEGQLRQRLVPVLAGIAALAVMGLLLRKLQFGLVGAFGLWVMATAPLMVRYSAYTRPYALPFFLMVLFVYAVQRWFDDHRSRWLALTAVVAIALPLARVPEPTMFLFTTAATLTWLKFRGRFSGSQAWPPVAISVTALCAVGLPLAGGLKSEMGSDGVATVTTADFSDRLPGDVHELVTGFAPLMSAWFPWWPITVVVVGLAFSLPTSRRRLFRLWFLLPLVLPAIAWVLIYHLLSPYPLDQLPYRPRSFLFFVPAFVFVVVALGTAVVEARTWPPQLKIGLGSLLAALLLGQLPATANVLTDSVAPDYEQVADVLTIDLPKNAIVLYHTPSPAGWWHQPFSARPRYMGDTPYVGSVARLATSPKHVPKHGPVYVLMLDSECAYSGLCDEPPQSWNENLPGWRVKTRFDRFTVYEPDEPLSGRAGALHAMLDFADALGPDLGASETFTAAALLKLEGHPNRGRALIRQMYTEASPEEASRIRKYADRLHLNPFT